ncbi:hypothetical protein [Streptomyces hayashii]|uniref:hypothetical protein n=1 Tax=Streptomyces hayashii TaxID=2839966 RepID=UPI00403C9E9D
MVLAPLDIGEPAGDPARYGPRLLVGTEDADERALSHWAAWAAGRDAEYGLGATRRACGTTSPR